MWKVLGGSTTGKLHVQSGKGNDDSFGWFATDTAVCLVVADGAGSRSRAAMGSRTAVDAAVSCVQGLWGHDSGRTPDLLEPFHQARRAIEALAAAEGMPTGEFATTMAIAIATETTLEVGQIGDSIVVARHGGGAVEAIGPASRGEYINETVFLTSDNWSNDFRRESRPIDDIDGLALSTDGLQYKILDDIRAGTPFAPFFEDIFPYVVSPKATDTALIEFLDNLDDQSGDDKTLLLAVRVP